MASSESHILGFTLSPRVCHLESGSFWPNQVMTALASILTVISWQILRQNHPVAWLATPQFLTHRNSVRQYMLTVRVTSGMICHAAEVTTTGTLPVCFTTPPSPSISLVPSTAPGTLLALQTLDQYMVDGWMNRCMNKWTNTWGLHIVHRRYSHTSHTDALLWCYSQISIYNQHLFTLERIEALSCIHNNIQEARPYIVWNHCSKGLFPPQ